jgi:hypothetical protein
VIAAARARYLHCPAFLRLSIVCRQNDVQAFPAANWGPRFWQLLMQILTSQPAASAGRAATKDSPKMRIVDKIASDKRHDMDISPK